MSQKDYSPEEIIHKIREAEILISQGLNVKAVARQLGVTDHVSLQNRTLKKLSTPNQDNGSAIDVS